jgi:hypothetical protein
MSGQWNATNSQMVAPRLLGAAIKMTIVVATLKDTKIPTRVQSGTRVSDSVSALDRVSREGAVFNTGPAGGLPIGRATVHGDGSRCEGKF